MFHTNRSCKLIQYKLDALIVLNNVDETTMLAAFAGYPLIVVISGCNKSNDELYDLCLQELYGQNQCCYV